MKVICWESKLTNAKGRGTLPLPDEHVEEVVKKLNEEHPELHHWAEKVDDNE